MPLGACGFESRLRHQPNMYIVFIAFIFVYAVVIHEVAHGWVAFHLGDSTAEQAGRLTLNPLPHIDPIGSIVVPAVFYMLGGFPFGWAKPVPVNPYAFRDMRKGMLLVSLAGPLSNITMAIGIAGLAHSSFVVRGNMAWEVLEFGVMINLVLALFNLIPIPPLDGSKVLASILPRDLAAKFESLGRYGMILFVILIMSGAARFLIVPPLMFMMNFLGFG